MLYLCRGKGHRREGIFLEGRRFLSSKLVDKGGGVSINKGRGKGSRDGSPQGRYVDDN